MCSLIVLKIGIIFHDNHLVFVCKIKGITRFYKTVNMYEKTAVA